ncbi:MAG: CSLREA domain-containing protein, partial [Chloroflexi bacterium]
MAALLGVLWLLGAHQTPAARAYSPIVTSVSPVYFSRCRVPDSPCAALPDFAGAPTLNPSAGPASAKAVAVEHAAVLAFLPVNTFTDDISTNGNCTLREAIIAANENRIVDACPTGVPGPDVITLTAGLYSLGLPGTGEDAGYTGDLDVTEALTIVGAGSGLTAIDAGGLDRVFNIFSGPVELVGLTLQNGGNVDNGGGIFNTGTLKLTDVVITGNLAISSVVPVVGGGIDNAGTLEMTDSAISFNTARATGPANFSDGGGLHSSGAVTLTRTLVNNNQADSVAGGIGGGIFNEMNLVTLVDSRVLTNSAHQGGGLYNQGDVALNNSRVSGNTATVGAGMGGGIVNEQGLVLTGSLVGGNWAQLGAGGIWNKLATATVQIDNSSVAGNSVFGGDGGGIVNSGRLTATATSIEANAALSGGGIHNTGTLFLKNSKLILNGSTLTSGGGGGLLNFGQMRVESSQVLTNSATNLGGGAFNGVAGTLVISNTTVQANSAITGGGGIYN